VSPSAATPIGAVSAIPVTPGDRSRLCTVSIDVPVYSAGWLICSHPTDFFEVVPSAAVTSNVGSHASIGALATTSMFRRVRSFSERSGPASGKLISGWLRTTTRTVEPTIRAST
jgi:hypothetical protein